MCQKRGPPQPNTAGPCRLQSTRRWTLSAVELRDWPEHRGQSVLITVAIVHTDTRRSTAGNSGSTAAGRTTTKNARPPSRASGRTIECTRHSCCRTTCTGAGGDSPPTDVSRAVSFRSDTHVPAVLTLIHALGTPVANRVRRDIDTVLCAGTADTRTARLILRRCPVTATRSGAEDGM